MNVSGGRDEGQRGRGLKTPGPGAGVPGSDNGAGPQIAQAWVFTGASVEAPAAASEATSCAVSA